MKIYTRKGDAGTTSLFGGRRVRKDSLRIEAYGCVDELNSQLGVVRSFYPPEALDSVLQRIQNDLFTLGADLATPVAHRGVKVERIGSKETKFLEETIDGWELSLSPLTSFILPGGSPTGAHLHVARTVCRRAERAVIRLAKKEKVGAEVIVYLNRLSDLLFVAARRANRTAEVPDVEWHHR
jgi:cob(I)alamin adenosyltransferase